METSDQSDKSVIEHVRYKIDDLPNTPIFEGMQLSQGGHAGLVRALTSAGADVVVFALALATVAWIVTSGEQADDLVDGILDLLTNALVLVSALVYAFMRRSLHDKKYNSERSKDEAT